VIFFVGDYCAGCCNMAFENPTIFGGKIVTVEQILSQQLSADDESVASKGQALGAIRSRLGVVHQNRVWTMPYPVRLVEVSLLIF